MLLERIYDTDLAQASYFIGCQVTGEALVVDPRRDTAIYLETAQKNGMRIVAVTETHIHADYLSGTKELASRTGAQMYVSDEGGPDWAYGSEFDGAHRVKDGDRILLGNITIEAIHTPGHTPEHISFLVTDGAQATEPGFMLTGDFVFVGDVGRPDLLDEAAGFEDTRYQGARDLFASLRNRFVSLPDYVQVLPGHGSGSACGKSLGSVAATTVGYERTFSWWAQAVRDNDEDAFIAELLSGQPDAHAYFGRMKMENRVGPAPLGERPTLIEYDADRLQQELDEDAIILVDTRHHRDVHDGTVAGALNIPSPAKAASYAAWVYDPLHETRPLVLLARTQDDAHEMRDHLVRVGIDTVRGYVTSLEGLELVPPKRVRVEDLATADRTALVDVRNRTEFSEGHVPGAQQLSSGRVLSNLDLLPDPGQGTIITYCQSGVRNSIVASALRRKGYDVAELEGSYNAWTAVHSMR